MVWRALEQAFTSLIVEALAPVPEDNAQQESAFQVVMPQLAVSEIRSSW